ASGELANLFQRGLAPKNPKLTSGERPMNRARRNALTLAGASLAAACCPTLAIASQAQEKGKTGLPVVLAGSVILSKEPEFKRKAKFDLLGKGFKLEEKARALHVTFEKPLGGNPVVIVTGLNADVVSVTVSDQGREGFWVRGFDTQRVRERRERPGQA